MRVCWSGEASAVIATIGLGSTAYIAYKGESPRLWLPLGYFSLMEALQAYTYTVIDDCANPANQVSTYLGYLHIVFQPFLINLISLYFIPERVRKRIEIGVFSIVFAGAILMLLIAYPFVWAKICDIGHTAFCGERICSVRGSWHIAWEMPRTGIAFGGWVYLMTGFALPVLYGSWRMTLYHALTGPLLAYLTTGNWNEWAAVWCLYSIGLLAIAAKTPVKKWLHVKSWPIYRLFPPA